MLALTAKHWQHVPDEPREHLTAWAWFITLAPIVMALALVALVGLQIHWR